MHIRLIDGNSIGYAQYHAQPEKFGAGMAVHAVEGFIRHMRRWLQVEPDTLHVVLWDGRAQWRYDLAPEYKSGRQRTEQQRQDRAAFEAQRPWIQKALSFMPVVQVTHPFMEADDLAYALSDYFSTQGHLVTLFTADFDWLQCVQSRVTWMNARKREHVVDEYSFRKDTGCASSKAFVEVKALMGDASDDLPGVPGIQDVRAKEIINQWGTLAAFWKAAEDPFFQGTKYQKQAALPEMRAQVARNKLLMDLSAAPTPDATLAEIQLGEYVDIELYEVFVDLELTELCETFHMFSKPLEAGLSKEQSSLLRRAVANMAKSYG
jgi:DNA polymerase I